MTHSYRRGQYYYIISSILYIWIHERHQDDSIHVHLSISRGQHVCITHRFGHYQLMSQAESDVTERKEEDIALCHPHHVSLLHPVCAGPPPRTTLCWCTLSPRCSPTLPSTTSRARSSCPPSPTPGHSEECNQYISFK